MHCAPKVCHFETIPLSSEHAVGTLKNVIARMCLTLVTLIFDIHINHLP